MFPYKERVRKCMCEFAYRWKSKCSNYHRSMYKWVCRFVKLDLDWFQCREMAKKCMCGFEYHLKSMRPNCRMSMYMQVLV